MEYYQRRAKSLVVLTLLQLCRAEIKDTQPQWYSANIINDGFQPKSISELFPTEATFSTANPIVVLSNSDNDIRPSTLTPPSNYPPTLPSSATFKSSTTMFPSSSQSSQLSSFSPSPSPSSQPIQYNIEQNRPFPNQPLLAFQQQTQAAGFETQPIQPLQKLVLGLQPQRVQNQQEQLTSTQNLPQNPIIVKFNPTYQVQPTGVTMPQDMPIELVAQNDQSSTEAQSTTTRSIQTIPAQPNYILLYPQTPQPIQIYPDPTSSPRTSLGEASFTTSAPPITSTLSPTISSFSPFSTVSSLPTSPLLISTTQPPSTQNLLPSTSPRVTVTPLSTIGSSKAASTGNSIVTNVTPRSTTPLPILDRGRPLPIDQLFPIKIRVVAPSGSITNVNINQRPENAQTLPKSTQRYIVTPKVTTRKPTTRRTQKPRKNTYERCLQGCRKNGQPLCAAPLSQFPVDTKTLRGFPSVCHMACHNSYRKDAFEKVIDGSCSKLRTRIRPIDSNSKLKREELHKVQYFLTNTDQQPILEISGAYS